MWWGPAGPATVLAMSGTAEVVTTSGYLVMVVAASGPRHTCGRAAIDWRP